MPTSNINKPNLNPHAPAFLAAGLDPPDISEIIPATMPISHNMPLAIKAIPLPGADINTATIKTNNAPILIAKDV